jgi:hypothetical protein
LFCVLVTIGIGTGAIDLDGVLAVFYFLSIPITIISPLIFFRFLKVRLVPLIEARDFAAGGAQDRHGQDEFANKLFPFPIFLVITFVLTGLALVASQHQAWFMQPSLMGSEQIRYVQYRIGLISLVAAAYFVVSIFFLFLEYLIRPFADKRRKHEYALPLVEIIFPFGLVFLVLVDMQQGGSQIWLAQFFVMGLEQTLGEPTEIRLLFWAVVTLLVVFFFLAFLEQIRPYGNRRRKYDYALALTSTIWLGHELFLGSYKTLVFQPLIALALALVTAFFMRLICKPADNPGPAARKTHLWIKALVDWPVVVVLALWLPIALAVVLVMRYRCVQWMANCPIVYLRSFSQENAPRVFQRVITPEANSYGVLVALVHQTQSASNLKGSKDLMEGSQFSGTSDDKWKAWVADKIKHASAIIIDYSIPTEGVRWEVERAVKKTDPERIVLLAQHDSNIEAPAGAHVIKYEDSKAGFKAARMEFYYWVYARVMG